MAHTLELRVLYRLTPTDVFKKHVVQVNFPRVGGGGTSRAVQTSAWPFSPQPGLGPVRVVAAETDPCQWKNCVLNEVVLDTHNRKVICHFVDGEAILLNMPDACLARLLETLVQLHAGEIPLTLVNSDLIDLYRRFVLHELHLPPSFVQWQAESALVKQEKRIRAIDGHLDTLAKAVQESKMRMRTMREHFAHVLVNDNTALIRHCGPVFLETLLEGIETDISDYNKQLNSAQSRVDSLKRSIAALEVAIPEAEGTSTSRPLISVVLSPPSSPTQPSVPATPLESTRPSLLSLSSSRDPLVEPSNSTAVAPTAGAVTPTSKAATTAIISTLASLSTTTAVATTISTANTASSGASSTTVTTEVIAMSTTRVTINPNNNGDVQSLRSPPESGSSEQPPLVLSPSSSSCTSPATVTSPQSTSAESSAVASAAPTPVLEYADDLGPRRPSPVYITLEQARTLLEKKRRERDAAFEQVNMHIEAREKCKGELRARKQDEDRAVTALVASQDGEHEYVNLWRHLREMRSQRNFLTQDKLMAVNAREVSKAEIRQIKELTVVTHKRTQTEVAKKRRNKKQVWQSGRFVE